VTGPNRDPAAAGLIALAAVVFAACGGGAEERAAAAGDGDWTRGEGLAAVEIVVDLVGAHDGRIPVRVTAMDARPTHFAVQSAWTDGYRYHDVRFADSSGNALEHEEAGGRYVVPRTEDKTVVASYEVELGGPGRHGNQGVVAADHVLFDGRLFLLPEGAVPVGSARIRFLTPDGWSVASPFREDGSWHYVDAFEPELTAKVLGATCCGVGEFDRSVRQLGAMEVRVASYSAWDVEHKRTLDEKTFRMLGYFHDTLGFDLEAPYSVVWVPKTGRSRVFGGSFANGTCFEHPADTQRNWELLAHRIAHAMNEYRPSGMQVRDERDAWFTEGWASYMEARATEALELAEPDSRWNLIHESYKRVRRRTPERDVALQRERDARDATQEYLHYVKAPLAMKMLERWMAARSDHDLEQFVAQMWPEYGGFRKPFPFKEALESFAGVSFDDFWSLMVDRQGYVVPVWADYLTPGRRSRMQQAPAARVGGTPLQGDYLFHLAWSGDFKSFESILRFLEGEELRRRELDAAGVRILPDEIREHLFALDAEDRYALARLERAYPLGAGSTAGDRAATTGPVAAVSNLEQEDGRIFAGLLAQERVRATALGAAPSVSIRLRTVESPSVRKNPVRLAFEDDRPVRIAISSVREFQPTEIMVVSDGRVASRVALAAGAGSEREASVDPAARPSGSRIITLRVENGGPSAALSRAYWQRAAKQPLDASPDLLTR
jgi:hypothetical protein